MMMPLSLGLIPIDFFVLLALMFLVVVLLMGWMNASEKCNRLREAVRESLGTPARAVGEPT